jgi:type IV secretion system T-DNA border endonuclease VirD1
MTTMASSRDSKEDGLKQAEAQELSSRALKKQGGGNEADQYKVVCVRLRAAEFDRFAEESGAMGLTSSMALRIAARRIGGFLEVDRECRQELEDLLRSIGILSQALRDLHGTCLAGGMVTIDQLDDQRISFGSAFAQLDGMLRCILNVSLRRADGRSRLADAAAE